MRDYQFIVSVGAENRAQAEQVMSERIDPDEDYGFDYTIGWTAVDATTD